MSISHFGMAPLTLPLLFQVVHAINYGGFDDTTTTKGNNQDTKATSADTKATTADTKTASTATAVGSSLSISTNSASEMELTHNTSLDSEILASATQTQTGLASYNQWGFTGSQSVWGDTARTASVELTSVFTLGGTTHTVLVASSVSNTISSTGSTNSGTSSNTSHTETKSSSSSLLSSTSSSGASKMAPVAQEPWKRTAMLMSLVALTVGLHCV